MSYGMFIIYESWNSGIRKKGGRCVFFFPLTLIKYCFYIDASLESVCQSLCNWG